jgi:signal transduction histidine kinase
MSAGMDRASRLESDQGGDVAPSAIGTPALLTRLERGQARTSSAAAARGASSVPRWVERLLRIPLVMKLAGANAFLLIAAAVTAIVVRNHELSTAPVIAVVGAAFLIALLVNIALVNLAVRPMTMLEETVDTIWHGDLNARVPTSLLADRHVARVGRMFNILLDGLVADRARTRRLAVELITAGDRERAAISRELHDSTAQSLAALVMQLSVVAQSADDAADEILKQRLESARALATATLEEVRLLAHTMHPRVLDDLGLVAALRRLARETTAHATSSDGLQVDVVARDGIDETIPAAAASVLYRVAQEAVRNASRHAAARHLEIRVWTDADTAMLEVSDDGVGFDPEAARPNHTGIGLFTMRERVALVDGDLHVTSRAGGGTSVVASVPLRASTELV